MCEHKGSFSVSPCLLGALRAQKGEPQAILESVRNRVVNPHQALYHIHAGIPDSMCILQKGWLSLTINNLIPLQVLWGDFHALCLPVCAALFSSLYSKMNSDFQPMPSRVSGEALKRHEPLYLWGVQPRSPPDVRNEQVWIHAEWATSLPTVPFLPFRFSDRAESPSLSQGWYWRVTLIPRKPNQSGRTTLLCVFTGDPKYTYVKWVSLTSRSSFCLMLYFHQNTTGMWMPCPSFCWNIYYKLEKVDSPKQTGIIY